MVEVVVGVVVGLVAILFLSLHAMSLVSFQEEKRGLSKVFGKGFW